MTLAESPTRPSIPSADEPRPARFTKAEYFDMVERGTLAGVKRHVFLFRGELIEMPPMGGPHAFCVERVSEIVYRAMSPRFAIRVQCPFDAIGNSTPEPDVAVYTRDQSKRRPHPNAAEWVIEIADSSRKLDAAKAHDYAASVGEYWVLDVMLRQLSVYRNAHPDAAGLYGQMFDAPLVIAEADAIAPLCEPTALIVVRDLLPER